MSSSQPAASSTVRSPSSTRNSGSAWESVSRIRRAASLTARRTVRVALRLRPWSIRWATVSQLDTMAAAAGLVLRDRWESFAGEPFDHDSARHVSVYTPGQG